MRTTIFQLTSGIDPDVSVPWLRSWSAATAMQ